jgi:serine/threonine protein kinase
VHLEGIEAKLSKIAEAQYAGRVPEWVDSAAAPRLFSKGEKSTSNTAQGNNVGPSGSATTRVGASAPNNLPDINPIGGYKFGKEIDSGGFGTVYEVTDEPNLAIKIVTGSKGKANAQLAQESSGLRLLKNKGYPTAYLDLIDVVEKGISRQAIIMKKIDGVLSKELMQTGKFSGISPNSTDLAVINSTTINQLKQFRSMIEKDNIIIDDFQFMIDRNNGSIYIIDPAEVKDLSDLKPKQIKLQLKHFLRRIDRVINSFEDIIRSNN